MPRRNSGPRLRFLEKRGAYYIVWTEGGRSRERSTGTRDFAAAQKALGEFIIARSSRRSGPRDPTETLVTDVLADYAEAHENTRAFTRIAYAVAALLPFWQGRMVAEIFEPTCRRYAKHRGVSDGTVRRELTVLRAAINSARLTQAAAVWLPIAPEPRDVWLTRSEAARLLRGGRALPRARHHLPLIILVALYTARRKEAISALRWCQVDLVNGTIDFRRPGQAETKKKRGKVRIHRKLLGHLRRVKARTRQNGDLDFVIQWGGRQAADIKKSFAKAVALSGIQKHVTSHTLKHTCISWMLQKDVSIWDVADFTATSVRTIEKVYGHHCPSHQERALKALG
jgi:integrase